VALNFADREAIRPLIVPRCTGIVINYALYLINHEPATAAEKAWARNALSSPAAIGQAVSYHVMNQAAFAGTDVTEGAGSGISDADLLSAVESAINVHFVPQYAPGE
jgi:hypothetical protein